MTHNHVYCDVVAGELICFFERSNHVAQQLISQILQSDGRYIEIVATMAEKFHALGLEQAEYFPFEMYLFRVDEGSEVMKINWLHEEYTKLVFSNLKTLTADFINQNHFYVVPNSYHSLNFPEGSDTAHPNRASEIFQFTETHEYYKMIMGFNRMSPVENYKGILIIDSGVQTDHGLNIVKQVDFLSAYRMEKESQDYIVDINSSNTEAKDNYGHGTAIAKIINDICPGIPLTVFKIVNENGTCTEWDLVAALVAHTDAKIINVSLSYGLPRLDCGKCGRLSSSVRSYVLEYAINRVHYYGEKIIVVSGGNSNSDKLSFPARYDDAVGVISINKSLQKSSFSNFGNLNAWGEPHPCILSAFGGEVNTEPIFYLSNSKINGWGTSFANCYVVGLLSYLWSRWPDKVDNGFLHVRNCMINYYTTIGIENFDERILGKGILYISEISDECYDRYIQYIIDNPLPNQIDEL